MSTFMLASALMSNPSHSENTPCPASFLHVADRTPVRARFPVIDAHNHLWSNWGSVADVVKVMDAVGVEAYCDLTANIALKFGEGGYVVAPGSFDNFVRQCADCFPNRFYAFTTANLVQSSERPLFADAKAFVQECLDLMHAHAAAGARGLKVLKDLGLFHRDGTGALIRIDDERLAPIWEEAGRMGLPVLIHQADPFGFFLPPTADNEHRVTLEKYPAWNFSGDEFPSFDELQRRYRQLLRNHPGTTFLLPHLANWPENLEYVAELLDAHPNAYVDFSARTDELGRQPYTARDFLIRYEDRIYFGTDMPASEEMYRYHFRFLETFDEWIVPPDYDGSFGRHRWRVTGLGLPDATLRKLYYENALRLIPRLREDIGERFPAPDSNHPNQP